MATIKGGDKFERYLRDLATRVARPATLKVGIPANATYPDGTSVALVAAAQEFGTRSIPARSFMRRTVAEHQGEWPDALAKCLKVTDMNAAAALALMGEGIKGQVQQTITEVNAPPLKPATVRRKGFSKPLVDTGQMLRSITATVEEGA